MQKASRKVPDTTVYAVFCPVFGQQPLYHVRPGAYSWRPRTSSAVYHHYLTRSIQAAKHGQSHDLRGRQRGNPEGSLTQVRIYQHVDQDKSLLGEALGATHQESPAALYAPSPYERSAVPAARKPPCKSDPGHNIQTHGTKIHHITATRSCK